MKCPNCGAKVLEDQIICEECNINIVEARKSRSESETKKYKAGLDASEEVENLKQKTRIAEAKADLDKTNRDAANGATISDAQTNTEVVRQGATAKVLASEAEKNVQLNIQEVIQKENETAYQKGKQDIELEKERATLRKTIKIFYYFTSDLEAERYSIIGMLSDLNAKLEKRNLSLQFDTKSENAIRIEEKDIEECDLCLLVAGNDIDQDLHAAFELHISKNSTNISSGLCFAIKDKVDCKDLIAEMATHNYRPSRFGNIDSLRCKVLLEILTLSGAHGFRDSVKVEEGKVVVDGKKYIELNSVPFARNNEEYNSLKKKIESNQQALQFIPTDNPLYSQIAEEIYKDQEKLSKMESSLWETALWITERSTTKCSERLQRAMDLFSSGDNKGANAVLNEEEIERDVKNSIQKIKTGEKLIKKEKEVLRVHIEELRLKVKTVEIELSEGWLDKIVRMSQNIVEWTGILYGKEGAEYAASLSDLGEALRIAGHFFKALESEEEALSIRKSILGEKNRDTARSYSSVGRLYGVLDKHMKAIRYQEIAIKILISLYGKYHPDVAISYDLAGTELKFLGSYYRARKYKEAALRIRRRIYGENHPEIIESYNNLGVVYGELGNNKRALSNLKKALTVGFGIFGNSVYPMKSKILLNIGHHLSLSGNHQKALVNIQEAMNIQLAYYGKYHPENVLVSTALGDVFSALGNHLCALKNYQYALEMYLAFFDKHSHQETAECYDNIGLEYSELGDHNNALKNFEKALQIFSNIYGLFHPNTATLFEHLATEHKALGDHRTAIEYLQDAVNIRCTFFGDADDKNAQLMRIIGSEYRILGEYKNALDSDFKAVNILLNNKNDFELLKLYYNIGCDFREMALFDKAIEFVNKSFKIAKKLKLSRDVFGRCHNRLGKIYYLKGELSSAKQHYVSALEFLPEDNPDYLDSKKQIEDINDKLIQ